MENGQKFCVTALFLVIRIPQKTQIFLRVTAALAMQIAIENACQAKHTTQAPCIQIFLKSKQGWVISLP